MFAEVKDKLEKTEEITRVSYHSNLRRLDICLSGEKKREKEQ